MEIDAKEYEKIISSQKGIEVSIELPTGIKTSAKSWGPRDSTV